MEEAKPLGVLAKNAYSEMAERFEGIEFVSMAPAYDKRSLLFLLGQPSNRPGFFIDFTGHEELLVQVEALTDDISHDVISLLRGLLDGELCRREDLPVGAGA